MYAKRGGVAAYHIVWIGLCLRSVPNVRVLAQQATLNNYKNTKLKLLKANAAIWFNKLCRIRQLKPNYINNKINGQKPQDKRNINNAIRYRINQEVKFLYRKKQHLNQRLYYPHLETGHQYGGMWQHTQEYIDEQINRLVGNIYKKLNKKMDTLTTQADTRHGNNTSTSKFQTRIINLTNVKFTKEHMKILSLGPNYAMGKEPKHYIHELIIDTETAIRQLEPKIQDTYRRLAAKQIRHIMMTNRQNTLHKRFRHNMNELKQMLRNNNLIITKPDKSKAIVIINENNLEEKVDKFIQENHIKQINKDPTDKYQKQIQQTIQKCDLLRDKHAQIFLMNIKPTSPKLNIYIKTHKENEQIRPVINNTQAPSFKIAKYLNKKLSHLICLPHTYNTKNS